MLRLRRRVDDRNKSGHDSFPRPWMPWIKSGRDSFPRSSIESGHDRHAVAMGPLAPSAAAHCGLYALGGSAVVARALERR
jgi:hypothetical protein